MMRGPELYGREPQNPRFTFARRSVDLLQLAAAGLRLARARAPAIGCAPPVGSAPERVPDAQIDSVGPLLETGDARGRPTVRVSSTSQGDLYIVGRSRRARCDASPRRVAEEREPALLGRWPPSVLRPRQQRLLDRPRRRARSAADRRSHAGRRRATRRKAPGQRGTLEAQQRELFDVIQGPDSRANSVRTRRSAERARRCA